MRSFLSWVGGKSRLARQIVGMMPAHATYVEVFGGAAWVLFAKPQETSKTEVYNDLNGDLYNLFQVVRSRPGAFCRWQDLYLHSRKQYHRAWERYREGGWRSDVERAAMFYYLVKSAFGSIPGKSWRFRRVGKPQYNLVRKTIMNVHARLKRVFIECRDFQKLIKAWDHEDALFYCDPPYTVTLKPGNALYE